ncbi:thiamine biosynthetic bifunctional enzyme [Pseudogymnoascus australis]
MSKSVDYSLYLVTDSTPAILGDASLVDVVEAALEGGVTIVQYRDKSTETGVMVDTARRLHAVTKKYNVPLLINDRVDVALAVGCEGVHIGQDDIDIKTARRLLGDSAIIGLTVASVEQALQGCEDGADYLGIGTIFATPTKTNTKDIIGTTGCQAILKAIATNHGNVGTVCIGGINATNLQRVLYQSSDNNKSLDGIALVSAIIGAKNPKEAAQNLKRLVNTPPAFVAVSPSDYSGVKDVAGILKAVPSVIKSVNETNPLCHNMTNLVVQNFAASVALAIGGSPIMSNHGDEAADLAKLGGALVINMGTVTQEGLRNHLLALRAYNSQGGPVVLDPVGAAATSVRKSALKTLMAGGYFDLIKGNEGEIRQAYGKGDVQQRGVDSGASMLDGQSRAALVRDLAERERNIVLMTGSTDYVSDGRRTIAVKNGHKYLGQITGSGCVLGTTISAMLAVHRHDKLIAAVAGLLLFEIAAEYAAQRPDVKGPGTFVPALIDELDRIRQSNAEGDFGWLSRADISLVSFE